MKFKMPPLLLLSLAFFLVASVARAEHRATRLGNPAFRFAPPLRTPDDLRERFRNEKLKPMLPTCMPPPSGRRLRTSGCPSARGCPSCHRAKTASRCA
jgi:hypothetical protein